MSIEVELGKRAVQFGISSYDGVETLVTNGCISEFTVEIKPTLDRFQDPALQLSPGLIWPSRDHFDVSGFQRIKEEGPKFHSFSAMDGGAVGANCGMRLELGTTTCPRCRQYRHIIVYFYGGDKRDKRYKPMCLTCLEAALIRSEADVQS